MSAPEPSVLPATPLPWVLFNDRASKTVAVMDGHSNKNDDCPVAWPGFDSGQPYKRSAQNARYIVHACNSYPQLVAALKEFVTAEESFHDEAFDTTMDDALADAYITARTLLRALGEVK